MHQAPSVRPGKYARIHERIITSLRSITLTRPAGPGPRGAAGAPGSADLRAGRAPDRGDLPVPAPGRRLRRPPRLGIMGPALLLSLAGVEMPARPRHRPRAGASRQ